MLRKFTIPAKINVIEFTTNVDYAKQLKTKIEILSSEVHSLLCKKEKLLFQIEAIEESLEYLLEEKGIIVSSLASPGGGAREVFLDLLVHKHKCLLHLLSNQSIDSSENLSKMNRGVLSGEFSLGSRRWASPSSGFMEVSPFAPGRSIVATGIGRGGTTALASVISRLPDYKFFFSQSAQMEDDLINHLVSDLEKNMAALTHLVYDRDISSPRWAFKAPNFTYLLRGNADLRHLFSHRNIVIIFRDAVACACSESLKIPDFIAKDYLAHYLRIFESIAYCIGLIDQYGWGVSIISYERLKENPRKTIGDLCDWIYDQDEDSRSTDLDYLAEGVSENTRNKYSPL